MADTEYGATSGYTARFGVLGSTSPADARPHGRAIRCDLVPRSPFVHDLGQIGARGLLGSRLSGDENLAVRVDPSAAGDCLQSGRSTERKLHTPWKTHRGARS